MLLLHDEKMEATTQNVLRNLFRAICIIGAILLIGYCIREYALDQDVTHIEYKKFHEQPDDLYPSITLCFYNPFFRRRLSESSENLTIDSYEYFLSGYDDGQWNASFSDIDYDSVSIDFMNYLEYVQLNLLNNDDLRWRVENRSTLVDDHDNLNYSMVKPPEIYTSARWYNKKCFTINVPYVENKRIYFMYLRIRRSIFVDNIRPRKQEFVISMHYPNQLMRSLLLSRVNWESNVYRTDCFRLKVRVGSMEVLKRRNKYQAPCNDDLEGHDNITLTRLMKDAGCSPNHWKMESKLPICNRRSQYGYVHWLLQDVEEHLPPCQSIERLITTANGENCNAEDRDLHLTFYFQEPLYKEINVLRAYGFQSLVGNAGKKINHLRYVRFSNLARL